MDKSATQCGGYVPYDVLKPHPTQCLCGFCGWLNTTLTPDVERGALAETIAEVLRQYPIATVDIKLEGKHYGRHD